MQRRTRLSPRLTLTALGALAMTILTSAQAPPGQQTQGGQQGQPIFRSSTRLVVQTVTVKDRDGNPVEGLTAQDFAVTEDGQPQDIAFVEFQRLPAVPEPPAGDQVAQAPPVPAPATPPAPVSEVASVTQGGFAPVPAGDARFRDRRLLVLYFDLAAMPPGDQIRSYQAALRYIGSQMTPADMVAIVTYEGGAVRIKQDFTGNKAQLQEAIAILIYGEDKDGDGVRDQTDQSTAFGQGDAEFNVFNTDRQLAALQTAVTMLRPFPEQKTLDLLRQRAAPERHRQHGPAARHHQRGDSRERDDQPGGRPRSGGDAAAWRRDAAVARRLGDVHRGHGGGVGRQLPAIAGHAVLAGEGHGRHGDVRQQRPVARASGARRGR